MTTIMCELENCKHNDDKVCLRSDIRLNTQNLIDTQQGIECVGLRCSSFEYQYHCHTCRTPITQEEINWASSHGILTRHGNPYCDA